MDVQRDEKISSSLSPFNKISFNNVYLTLMLLSCENQAGYPGGAKNNVIGKLFILH
jgi:hypothetical protein